jgi:hypothetical protein
MFGVPSVMPANPMHHAAELYAGHATLNGLTTNGKLMEADLIQIRADDLGAENRKPEITASHRDTAGSL